MIRNVIVDAKLTEVSVMEHPLKPLIGANDANDELQNNFDDDDRSISIISTIL